MGRSNPCSPYIAHLLCYSKHSICLCFLFCDHLSITGYLLTTIFIFDFENLFHCKGNVLYLQMLWKDPYLTDWNVVLLQGHFSFRYFWARSITWSFLPFLTSILCLSAFLCTVLSLWDASPFLIGVIYWTSWNPFLKNGYSFSPDFLWYQRAL